MLLGAAQTSAGLDAGKFFGFRSVGGDHPDGCSVRDGGGMQIAVQFSALQPVLRPHLFKFFDTADDAGGVCLCAQFFLSALLERAQLREREGAAAEFFFDEEGIGQVFAEPSLKQHGGEAGVGIAAGAESGELHASGRDAGELARADVGDEAREDE